MVKIRAKSVIKIDSGFGSLDYTYPAGASVDAVAMDILRAVMFNKGTDGTKKMLDDFIARHPGVPPEGKPMKEQSK